MARLNPYLHFNGNTREALEFYKECFGGELKLMTIGESPMAAQMPDKKDLIMHGVFTSGAVMLYASDMAGENKAVNGTMISLLVDCGSEEEINGLFEKMSDVALKVNHPLKEEFWGAVYGELTDKFGINWMFNFDKNAQK